MIVLDVGWMHLKASSKPFVSVAIWRLRPFTLLAGSKPRGPPLSVVLTLWVSITPAEGTAVRPPLRTRAHEYRVDPLPDAPLRQP